ncbi:hypothetical protein NQ318_022338 [Aromia moschata]|uniref:Gamma-glutamyltranspeptidase 1 n=1 Tax=Aromia moschata TaxID=1265417 RepID=A0AAV8Z6J9_9CUCU|nr:hypothetical protein NQ318_022338 [Aromia moschata]
MKIHTNKSVRKIVGAAILIAIIILAIGLVIYFTKAKETIAKASIVTNGYGCSDIGKSILEKGGNAADAAIATLFCEGVSMPQSMGLGGGFLLTIYNRTTGEVWSLNAREVAPLAATENMFDGDSNLSQKGPLWEAKLLRCQGELIGYWYLYERFGGQLPWRDLVQPTIDLCKEGVYVTSYLETMYRGRRDLLYADPVLREIFIDPTTNSTYVEGQRVKRLRLAKTLEVVADEGGLALHNGTLTETFVNDIREKGEWQQPIKTTFFNNETMYSSPLPGSGVILTFILNILSNFIDVEDPNSVTTNQRIVESFKFAYGKRTLLGDPNFVDINEVLLNLTSKEYAEEIRKYIFDNKTFQNASYYGANTTTVQDHGTANIAILAANGDAVSVTSTINLYFGAGFASNSTGIILNDEMDDFSSPNIINGFDLPPSPANYIAPGKRPVSSMCPSIIVDQDGGSDAGDRCSWWKPNHHVCSADVLLYTVGKIIMKNRWFGMDIKSAIDDKRIHHQLFPMKVFFEGVFANEDTYIVDGLHKIGHAYNITDEDGFAAATSISRSKARSGQVAGAYDKRRSGSISYIY